MLSIAPCVASAQIPGTGAIDGFIVDPQHHRVDSAEVTAIEESTHRTRTANSAHGGAFHFALLEPGRYLVTAKAQGFAEGRSLAVVTTGDTAAVQIALTLASATATVDVRGASSVAQLDSSTLGSLITRDQVETLPLSTRNYTQIIALAPGVISDLPGTGALGNGTQNVASNGAPPTANNIQFNGVDANNLTENSAVLSGFAEVGTAIPAPDAIEQFQVQRANFDASYGRGTGANVDLITRSGTNQFHGAVWEYLRNNIFNANEWFSKRAGQPRAELKQNQFGASLGGPILRDRTFFFGAYQGTRQANGLGAQRNPILPLLTNDRSAAALGALFCPAGHLNNAGAPASGYLTQAGGAQVACNGANINPVALTILNAKGANGQLLIPNPQRALPLTGANASDQLPMGQSIFAPPAYYNEDQFTVDLDQVLTAKNTLNGRLFYSRGDFNLPFPQSLTNLPGFPQKALNRNTNFVLADTHVVDSNRVNIARFGFIRFDGLSSIQDPLTSTALGQDTPTGEPSSTVEAPSLQVGGFAIGDAGNPNAWNVANGFIWQDVFAWTRGRNNMRFGTEFKRFEVDLDQPEETGGLLQIGSFPDFLVGQSAAQNGSPQGLSNVGVSQAGGGIYRRDTRYTDFAGFFQDDFKLTPRLTLNFGARYEIFSAPLETHGRLANFDISTAQQGLLTGSTFSGQTLPANFIGTIPAGVVRTPYNSFYKTPYGDVSPRFGFAWQVTQRPTIVVRGGYGIYYDRHSATISEQTLSQLPFATFQFATGSQNAGATLAHPFQPFVAPQSAYPLFAARTESTFPFIEATNPNLKDTRTQEYNLNIQYAPGRNYLLEVGYVGTSSVNRSGQWEFDQAALASPQNPINGETTNTVNNAATRMPIQGISEGSLVTDNNFIANYNSLQVQLTRRFTRGFQLQASYTWSKNLDEVNGEGGLDTFELQLPTNNQLDLRHSSYGLAGDDRDQRFVTNFVWNTPTLHSLPTILRETAAHWQFSGILVLQSGGALSVFDGNAGSVYGLLGGEVRAQLSGKAKIATIGSIQDRVRNGYLNPNAFMRAPMAPNGVSLADQDFGNSGVGIVRGPGQHNMDLSIERSFPLHFAHLPQETRLVFRTEFYNVTNTPQFGNPNTSLGYSDPTQANPTASSTFGAILGSSGNPRIIQFAGRLNF